ncbi:hypothetical protein ACFY8V_07620 [Streptomyces californicus]|nr:hypothetical protein [Streptomyces sp. sk226]
MSSPRGDGRAEVCGTLAERPTRRETERLFALDDVGQDLIALLRRGSHG